MLVVGCYRGKSLLSWKIKRETNSPISHVSIIQLPDDTLNPADGVRVNVLYRALETCPVYEAWREGVVCRRGIGDGHTPYTPIELLRIESSVRVPEAEIIRDLDRIVAAGTRYDWIGLLRYKLRINRDNPDRMFCSELLHHVLGTRGIFLVRRAEPHKVSPGDIYRSALLRELWTTYTEKRAARPVNASEGAARPKTAVSRRPALVYPSATLAGALSPADTLTGDGSGRCLPDFDPFNPQKERFA